MRKHFALHVVLASGLVCAQSYSEVDTGFSAKATSSLYKNNAQTSWLQGGVGRFDSDSGAANDIQLGYKAYLLDKIELSGHAQLRHSTDKNFGKTAGVIELKARYLQALDKNGNNRLLFTAGQFFLPTSMENTSAFWDSPYTISYSSLNSWIGQEFRPVGLDIDFRHKFSSDTQVHIAATSFMGNDSLGAGLAWRGWTYGRLLSVYNETHPLPQLSTLAAGGSFSVQQNEGSKPFGEDLDNKVGSAIRASVLVPGKYELKLSVVDNNGDKLLHAGEYAWETRFSILGARWEVSDYVTLLGEYSQGNTKMGPANNANVDFKSAYLLASYLKKDWRYSFRYDTFQNDDLDSTGDDINNDEGTSYTAAIFWQPSTKTYKLGAEILYLNGKKERLLESGFFSEENSYQFSLIGSYGFW